MRVAYVVICIFTGCSYALFALGYHVMPRRSLWLLLYVPALFVLVEYTKRFYAFGFTWGFLGYLTEDMPHVLLGTTLAGVLGLTFVIVVTNTGIATVLLDAHHRKWKKVLVTLGIVMAALGIVILGGWAVERFVLHETRVVRVAVMETRDQLGSLELNVSPYKQLFSEAENQAAEVIVMPESLIDPKRREVSPADMNAIINNLAGNYSGTVIVGGFRNEGGNRYNAAFFWHQGAIEATYDKHFLVPFAEYAPAVLAAFSPAGKTLYTRGAALQVPQAGGITFGALVCQEVNYPEAGTRPTANGAELLVSGANDGFVRTSGFITWLAPTDPGYPWFQQIEYRYAKFRAVENGRYLLRSTKVGIAGIISPTGESVEIIPSGSLGTRVSGVWLMAGLTPYTRFGDTPLLLFSVLCVGWVLYRKFYLGDSGK